MILSTQVPVKKQVHHQIDYTSKLLLLGSCFSENIGEKLNYYKFQTNQNTFGILFHPKAIENLITNAINEKIYTEDDIFFHNERWHCFEAHSSLSNPNKNELIDNLNKNINSTLNQLKEASYLIITLGTSWVYREIATDTVVANCHKIPQKKFLKELLSVDEITASLEAINTLVKSINKNIAITYTVSPVRHIKDGFTENQQSKSHLIAAIHQVKEARKNIFYFPSYEIMMDELRDYRFYATDMIHPNETAITYIWEKFIATWFSDNCFQTMKTVDAIQKGLQHRSFNPNSEAHQTFLKNLEEKISTLKNTNPKIHF